MRVRVRCPICNAEAEVDKEKREMMIYPSAFNLPKVEALRPPVSVCFPSHFDCELAKPVTEIDLTKLVKVEKS